MRRSTLAPREEQRAVMHFRRTAFLAREGVHQWIEPLDNPENDEFSRQRERVGHMLKGLLIASLDHRPFQAFIDLLLRPIPQPQTIAQFP
jgi:hypothetical protein